MAETRSWDGLEQLLQQRAEVDTADRYGFTALMMAAQDGKADVVSKLLEAGANCNKCNGHGLSALMQASRGGIEVLKMLLDAGANVNFAGNNGWTVLLSAIQEGRLDKVRLLLDAGADFRHLDHYHNSPLIAAATIDNDACATEMVRYLLNAGADPTPMSVKAPTKSRTGTAASVARESGKETLAKLLESHQEEWERPFVLTVTGAAVDGGLELTCRTISGSIAATLLWPPAARNYELKKAIVAAVESSFDCPIKPLRETNLRLVKSDATMLRLGYNDPPFAEQLQVEVHACAKELPAQ